MKRRKKMRIKNYLFVTEKVEVSVHFTKKKIISNSYNSIVIVSLSNVIICH